ncbi:hypothetical protein [Litchfieldia salsa]|uniref:Uncharacterized protein n=1 Tax=Litchfieldia salsa TaxID=930152 RepID=A0A1H0VRN9_9BACI|nr:hypothetical protein [Litchfieldia salsa]SDP80835.1 hypothetical protein SAMN05216565_107156 [Litchfieldia salsa]
MSVKDKAKNSSMTRNEEEMKEHGKVMEHLPTNKEVRKDGEIPDPKQEKKPKNEKS